MKTDIFKLVLVGGMFGLNVRLWTQCCFLATVFTVIPCLAVVYRVGRTFILHVCICFHIFGSHHCILQVCFSLYPGDFLTFHKTAVGSRMNMSWQIGRTVHKTAGVLAPVLEQLAVLFWLKTCILGEHAAVCSDSSRYLIVWQIKLCSVSYS